MMQNYVEHTKNEHFVPQVYLRGFSEDKKNIYYYDLISNYSTLSPVPIKSILYEKYLYELKNSDNELIHLNYIEKCLKKYEDLFPKYIQSIEKKAFIPDNFNGNYFLDSNEKAFWIVYTTVQMLRLPNVLGVAKGFTREYFSPKYGTSESENMALAYCMPFFEKIDENTKTAFNVFAKPLFNMKIEIGILEEDGVLITSDSPVYVESSDCYSDEYRKVIFPLSSKICLFFYGAEEKDNHKHNSLISITPNLYDEIVEAVAYRCNRFVVSERRINKKMIRFIRNAKSNMVNEFIVDDKFLNNSD